MTTKTTPLTPDGEIDWAAFEDDVHGGKFQPEVKRANPASKDARVHKYPCQGCGGTGEWRGRGKCFACNGKGYFLTSERDRQQARKGRQETKARKLEEAGAAFDEHSPDIRPFLVAAASWSSFAGELLAKLGQYGSLTEPQAAAVRRMAQKVEEKRAARVAERQAAAREVDLAPIRAMFEAAVTSGYKSPIYRAAGLVISRAPDSGRNPGALYVKDEATGDYLGKILGTAYSGKPAEALTAIAADPRGEAIKYGQRTGTCSCCGRTLTAEGSIEAGIGPICAEKWNL